MSRIAVAVGLAVLGLMLVLERTHPRAAPPAPLLQSDPAEQTRAKILELLNREKMTFEEQPADPQTKLGNMLNMLSQKFSRPNDKPPFHLTFEIDSRAFEAEGIKESHEVAIVADAPLLRAVNITLGQYLNRILERVDEKGPTEARSRAMFIVRRDYVEITTWKAVKAKIWGVHPGPYLPLIHATLEEKPLEDALNKLAQQSEYNIVLDTRVGEKAKTAASARFSNTPLDTAVTLLADMADLQPILQDNVIYVTTRDNALRLDAMNKNKQKQRIGPGLRGPAPLPVPERPADR